MPTPACVDHLQHVRCLADLELSVESLSKFGLVSLFMMEKQMPMSAILGYFRTVTLLLLVSGPLVKSSVTASNALHHLGDFTYDSIFSPLLKALSEHGGSRWNPGLRKKMKPEHKYMKYLTDVYKKSSRVQRSLDGSKGCNTIRLIKPRDECLAQSNQGKQEKRTLTVNSNVTDIYSVEA